MDQNRSSRLEVSASGRMEIGICSPSAGTTTMYSYLERGKFVLLYLRLYIR